jgi:hypothetical protein
MLQPLGRQGPVAKSVLPSRCSLRVSCARCLSATPSSSTASCRRPGLGRRQRGLITETLRTEEAAAPRGEGAIPGNVGDDRKKFVGAVSLVLGLFAWLGGKVGRITRKVSDGLTTVSLGLVALAAFA